MKRWTRRIFWGTATAAVVLLLLAVLILATALQAEPAVAVQPAIQLQDIARVLALVRQHDPRRAPPGQVRAVSLSAHELELLLNHGAQRWLGGASRASLLRGGAALSFSLHTSQLAAGAGSVASFLPALSSVPTLALGRWLNVHLQWVETGALPALEAVQIGRLPVPVWLAQWAALRVLDRVGLGEELPLLVEVVRRVKFMPGELQVVYVWRRDSTERMLSALVPGEEQRRLRVYADQVATLAAQHRGGWDISLADLIGPLFMLARERSAQGGDAALENRAAIVVPTLFANGRGVGDVVPAARLWPRARPLRVLLSGRDDWPRHFLVSAALASEGTGPMSQAIGLYKEIADSRGGSGFSFNDMAANRAGTRFGERAVQDAVALQDAVARGVSDADLLPRVDDLPEFMPEPEFLRRFGGVGAPGYKAMLQIIDARIASLALLR